MNTNKVNFTKILKKLLPIVIKTSPFYFLFYLVSDILQGLSYGVNTYYMKEFFDSIEFSQTHNITKYTEVYTFAIIVCLIMIGSQVLNGISNYMYQNMIKKLNGQLVFNINEKFSKIEPLSFQISSDLDNITKAKEGSEKSVELLFSFISMIAFHFSYMSFMLVYLYSIKVELLFAIILVFIPMSVSQFLKAKYYLNLADKTSNIIRKVDYYEDSIVGSKYIKDTRALNVFGILHNLFINNLSSLYDATWSTEKKVAKIEVIIKAISLVGNLIIYCLLFYYLVNGEISVGEFASVLTSIGMVFGIMQNIVDRNLALVSKNIGYAKNYFAFLELEEKREEIQLYESKTENKNIVFSNVSFMYPNGNKMALENINLEIKNGETIAIVGTNGSGKTTFSKLLLGLYKPTNGKVEVYGVNTNKNTPFKFVSSVFQHFCKYKTTLLNNITLFNNDELDKNTNDIIKNVNINLDKYYDKEKTILSKEFGGIDLSGGEWQKIAIARALYKEHSIIVLDEPTAAIDPVEEYNLYKKFIELSNNKTAIIITHRLGSAKLADKIIVFDNGSVVETGTHDELMDKNNVYSNMYLSQASWYTNI